MKSRVSPSSCITNVLNLFVIAGIVLVSVSGCASSPVVITKAPPQIKTKIFDKGMRPPEARNEEHNDCANTNWRYGFTPELAFTLNSRKRVVEGEQVSIKITKVKIGLTLEITMWLPEKASQDVIEHEKGHAAICLDNYKQAEKLASEVAMPFVNKEIVAVGPDFQTTLKELRTQVTQEMGRKYREETVDKANITSGLYDQMTVKEHAAADVNQRVADAELEYTRIWPTIKAKRDEEERLLKQRFGSKAAQGEKVRNSAESETSAAPTGASTSSP